jgi:hypothetical protein
MYEVVPESFPSQKHVYIVDIREIECTAWDSLQWYDVHTQFHRSVSGDTKVIKKRQACRHSNIHDYKPFFSCEENGLKLLHTKYSLNAQCSRECGTGLQKREVKCLDEKQQVSAGCPEDKRPPSKRICNTHECSSSHTGSSV